MAIPGGILGQMSDVTLQVRVQPRARREEIVGMHDGVLVVRVSAPALEGRANRALCKLLADHLGVAPSRVSVLRGEHARDKLVRILDIEQSEMQARLSGT